MADCEKLHAAIAAWIILNKNELDTVSKLAWQVDIYDRLHNIVWTEESAVLAKLSQDTLDAYVISHIINSDVANAYKPILFDRFRQAFKDSSYTNIVDYLDNFGKDSVASVSWFYKNNEQFFKALWIESEAQYDWLMQDVNRTLVNTVSSEYAAKLKTSPDLFNNL
jgi:hypothetical protein